MLLSSQQLFNHQGIPRLRRNRRDIVVYCFGHLRLFSPCSFIRSYKHLRAGFDEGQDNRNADSWGDGAIIIYKIDLSSVPRRLSFE